jgi:general secretion pathway protein A
LYQEFYHLKTHPFRLSPDPAFVCMIEQHREALSGLIYSVCTRPGLSVLIGEAGTGKTTLLYTLIELLKRQQYVTAICTNPTLTREEFYEFVLLRLGVTCAGASKTRQLIALEEALRRQRGQGRPAILIVDEAQRLPVELLEEIRLLLNLETPQEKLLEIVLAGQPELDETLNRSDLRQLRQRVGCICTLLPLNAGDIREYVTHRLTQAGRTEPDLFRDGAFEALYMFSRGIPRLINTIADTALRIGFSMQASSITSLIVDEAARELQLAPAVEAPVPAANQEVMDCLDAKLRENAKSQAAGANGGTTVGPVPLESYINRQKSLSFFGHWIGRMKS